jgi:hypothetical protein
MATSAERMLALREREREHRGLRRFTIGVSEDNQTIAVEDAIKGLVTKSANDAAFVERLEPRDYSDDGSTSS